MPRFYLDFYQDGKQISSDDEGTELTDMLAAQEEASRALGEFARDTLKGRMGLIDLHINVRNAWQRQILTTSIHFETQFYAPGLSS